MKFLIPILGNASLLFADGNADCCPKPKKECKTTCKEVCAPCPTTKICKTTCVEIRPQPPCECVTRACDCGVDFFITGDFTWWKARQDGMEFAQGQQASPIVSTLAVASSKIYNSKSKYEPGFKAGLGLEFCEWGWDLYANYTWFHTGTMHSTASVSSDFGLIDAYWFVNNPGNFESNIFGGPITSKWNVRMNIIDLELGRKYWIGKHIMLRPFAGFKGVWNKQRLFNFYNNLISSDPDVTFPTSTNMSMKNHEKDYGVGIRIGTDAAWHFSRGFSLFGDIALTALWERFKVHRVDKLIARSVTATFIDLSNKFYTVRPILEWMLGLNWETWWCGDSYHFAIWAGWEEQVWFDQNRFIRMAGSARQGNADLNLEGLTLGAMFEF